jgi:DnaJ-class molecular chaperone
MKLCSSCTGKGIVNFEICGRCGGEGVDNMATFTVGKVNRRKNAEFEIEEKKIKFDKKNAIRSV